MHDYQVLEKGKPLKEAGKALILLHGRGSSANNIIGLADEFADDNFYIAAPRATNNTWYPNSFLTPVAQNEPWLSSALQLVKQLIDETAEVLGTENIFVMGFSQGACLTLEVTSRYPAKYAGIVAFSGGLIGDTVNPVKYKGNLAKTKVFIGNSDIDPHVPEKRSSESAEVMKNLGADVMCKVYPQMAHTVIYEEIETVRSAVFSK